MYEERVLMPLGSAMKNIVEIHSFFIVIHSFSDSKPSNINSESANQGGNKEIFSTNFFSYLA